MFPAALSLLPLPECLAPYSMQAVSDPQQRLAAEIGRRKQKHPRAITSTAGTDTETDDNDKNGDIEAGRDITELVKVEIGPEEMVGEAGETVLSPNSGSPPRNPLPPNMEEIIRKCNLVPFGDVTVPAAPATPPILNFPMVCLFPVGRDDITGEARYKLLIPRGGPEFGPPGFPAMFPLPSPPLLPHLAPRFQHNFLHEEPPAGQSSEKAKKPKAGNGPGNQDPLAAVEVEGESGPAPLDLTHRSPSSGSDEEEEAARQIKIKTQSPASSPEQKLGSDIEEQLQFLKVKQMEFLKQAAESVVNRCNECNINFSKYQNFLAHKKYYCSGMKQQAAVDSDDEGSPATQPAPAKKAAPVAAPAPASPGSPPFPPSSSKTIPKQNFFNQEMFLSQKCLLESFPGKMPLLLAGPGGLPIQPPANSSHFICQGCGIKFKSISNLKVEYRAMRAETSQTF